MRCTLGLVALTITSLLGTACGGSAPASPSRADAAAVAAAIAVVQSAPVALFGASAVDFTSCLQAAAAPGCITAPRVRTSAVTAGALAPSAPAGLTATAVGSTVTLTWLAPTGTDPVYVYFIEAGSKPGAADLANFSTGTNVTTFSASGVGAGSYYVRVRASNSSGAGAASNEVLLVVGGGGACTSPPGAPSGLATAASGSTVTLMWSAPAGGCAPTSYMLQAGSAASLSNLANSNTGNTSTSYIAQGVGAGTYFVRILAANANGQSAASNESTLAVGTAPTAGVVTGRWIGLVSEGDGSTLASTDCGFERADIQLDLIQTGTSVTGTLTQTTVQSTCDPKGTVKVAPLTGTAGPGTLTWSIKPTLVATSTFTASRMTGTFSFGGTYAVNKR